MDDASNIKQAVDALLSNAQEMYGDAWDNFWMCEEEICPCCKKRKVEAFKSGEEFLVSLNSYIYRDFRVLIGYLLCGQCIADLFKPGARQKIMYSRIEDNLKKAYLDGLKSSAS